MSKIKVKGIKQLVDGTTQALSIGGILEDNSDEVLNIASNGDLQVKKVIQTNGIKFPATQVPSADPNTLDDYEEGTWTPIPTGTGVVTTYTSIGRYTKIGNSVHVDLMVDITNIGTATGLLYVSLPFVNGNIVSIANGREDKSTGVQLHGHLGANGSTIGVFKYDGNVMTSNYRYLLTADYITV